MANEIQLTQAEIDELNSLKNELREIKSKIRRYECGLIRSHGCNDVIGIMSYKKVSYNCLAQKSQRKPIHFLRGAINGLLEETALSLVIRTSLLMAEKEMLLKLLGKTMSSLFLSMTARTKRRSAF